MKKEFSGRLKPCALEVQFFLCPWTVSAAAVHPALTWNIPHAEKNMFLNLSGID